MSARKRRRTGGKRRPAEASGTRYLRPRLPDGSLGKVVPIEFYPRFSTLVGNPYAQDLFDVSAFRRVSIPKGRRLTIEVVTTDDPDREWDGLPTKSRRRAAARSAPRRRTARAGPVRKESSGRRLKTRGRTGGGQGA